MKHLLIAFWICGFSTIGSTMDQQTFFAHTNALLSEHVQNGYIDYASIKSSDGSLDKLIEYIASAAVHTFSDQEAKAFFINAYNLLVIDAILEHYPVKSPMDIKGFFDKQKHKVGGEMITLNALENEKIRAKYDDPRIHFVLVCAAKGCPRILDGAYYPDKLNEQLEKQTRKALNDDYFIRIQPNKNKVLISQIFNWYQGDFVKQEKELINYINLFRDKKLDPGYHIGYYEYDWKLNDIK